MEGQTQETSVLQGYADTLSTLVTNLKENFSPAGTLYRLFTTTLPSIITTGKRSSHVKWVQKILESSYFSKPQV